jgi:hypothetical protein
MKLFNPRLHPRLTISVVLASSLLVMSRDSAAQHSRLSMLDFAAGGEYENYLRVMQIAARVPLYPWSIRGFSRREISRLAQADSAGPWRMRDRLKTGPVSVGPLSLSATLNSAYPYGANDGPLWAGRGLTTAISGGVDGHIGPISLQVAPMAFRANNSSFELLPNGQSGAQIFGHGTLPNNVDLPQQFGNGPYARVDPGESSVRLDTKWVSLGVSTANEWIGPATEYPFLLGNNAAGFPHIFAGSGDPINVWIGRVATRVMWGKLDQSDYSPVTGSTRYISTAEPGTVRLAASAEALFLPRGIPGLEIGVARFFHVPYTAKQPSASFWKKPFRAFFLKNEYAQGDTSGLDNQLASIFFRWVFPGSGLEVYGERGYEDQFYDLREFIQDPDHDRAYMLGFQKILGARSGTLNVLKAELINYQLSTLARVRQEAAIYGHSSLRQGHTNRGQLLGAYPGAGSAGASTLSWIRYTARNRTTLTLRRILRDQRGNFHTSGIVDAQGNDVILAVGFERTRYGQHLDLGGKVEAMNDFDRNFSRDIANLSLQLMARLRP